MSGSAPSAQPGNRFQQTHWRDSAPHEPSSLTVDDGVQLEVLDFGQHGGGLKQEVAAVPQVMLRHVTGGGGGVGLLDERPDRSDRALALFRLDVAVSGLRRGGDDPERDHATEVWRALVVFGGFQGAQLLTQTFSLLSRLSIVLQIALIVFLLSFIM